MPGILPDQHLRLEAFQKFFVQSVLKGRLFSTVKHLHQTNQWFEITQLKYLEVFTCDSRSSLKSLAEDQCRSPMQKSDAEIQCNLESNLTSRCASKSITRTTFGTTERMLKGMLNQQNACFELKRFDCKPADEAVQQAVCWFTLETFKLNYWVNRPVTVRRPRLECHLVGARSIKKTYDGET